MEPQGSLPDSQLPATCSYPEPARSSLYLPHYTSWRSILIFSSSLRLGLPSDLLLSGFPSKSLNIPLLSPIRATRPAHLVILDFITRKILGEEYRSISYRYIVFIYIYIYIYLCVCVCVCVCVYTVGPVLLYLLYAKPHFTLLKRSIISEDQPNVSDIRSISIIMRVM